MLTGKITPDNQTEGEEIFGDFLGYKLWLMIKELRTSISSNENATCDDISKYQYEGSADIFNVLSHRSVICSLKQQILMVH